MASRTYAHTSYTVPRKNWKHSRRAHSQESSSKTFWSPLFVCSEYDRWPSKTSLLGPLQAVMWSCLARHSVSIVILSFYDIKYRTMTTTTATWSASNDINGCGCTRQNRKPNRDTFESRSSSVVQQMSIMLEEYGQWSFVTTHCLL